MVDTTIPQVENDMLWINEGFVLDDAGNMITTSYIDLRDKDNRTVIPALVKGCKREHALEDGETVLISKLARFREYGEALIRDEQEGFAKEEVVTLAAETAADAAKRRATEDLNEAHQLLESGIRFVHRVEHSSRKTQRKNLTFGKERWIFSTSIRPKNDDEWDAWRATLDDDYNHVSEIGRPAKFAEALARMVTEQIGPQGKDGWLTGTSDGTAGARTKHKLQWVIHGPVVYTDRLYDMLTDEGDEVRRLVATLFAKPATHAAQQEYRFVVMNEGATDETVLLKISGMMRDALRPAEGGLIRPSPSPADMVGEDGLLLPRGLKTSTTPRYERKTVTERKKEREETRWETKSADGQTISSDIKQRESVKERVSTQDLDIEHRGSWDLCPAEKEGEAEAKHPVFEIEQGSEEQNSRDSEEEVAKDLALAEREWNDDRRPEDELRIPVIHRGSGRTYKSFEEMLDDPEAPMSPSTKTWEVSACSPEEIVKSYGAVATLAMKIPQVEVEHRQDAASACWHALQCINNIYARLGDIIDSVWIERERFVVIHIKDSEALKATGRIVIAPSGVYSYCFKSSKSERIGHSEGHLGKMFFPLGNDVETFESFGWPGKQDNKQLEDKEKPEF